jgi:hypothetical protein
MPTFIAQSARRSAHPSALVPNGPGSNDADRGVSSEIPHWEWHPRVHGDLQRFGAE